MDSNHLPSQGRQRHEIWKQHKTKTTFNHRSAAAAAAGSCCVPLQRNDQYYKGMGDAGSGMRAIFLVGGSGNSTTAAGTGVFLPGGMGNSGDKSSTESCRKPRCSTVLIPLRVTQALTLHFEKMAAPSWSRPHAAADRRNSTGISTHTDKIPPPTVSNNVNDGLKLPEEWIY